MKNKILISLVMVSMLTLMGCGSNDENVSQTVVVSESVVEETAVEPTSEIEVTETEVPTLEEVTTEETTTEEVTVESKTTFEEAGLVVSDVNESYKQSFASDTKGKNIECSVTTDISSNDVELNKEYNGLINYKTEVSNGLSKYGLYTQSFVFDSNTGKTYEVVVGNDDPAGEVITKEFYLDNGLKLVVAFKFNYNDNGMNHTYTVTAPKDYAGLMICSRQVTDDMVANNYVAEEDFVPYEGDLYFELK